LRTSSVVVVTPMQVSRVAAEGTQRLVLSRDGIEAWVAAATAGASV